MTNKKPCYKFALIVNILQISLIFVDEDITPFLSQ